MKSHLIAAAVLATGISSSALAAVLAAETFEGYAAGADLAGNSGGTGFAAAWLDSGNPNKYDVVANEIPALSGINGYSGTVGTNSVSSVGALGVASRDIGEGPQAGSSYYFSAIIRPTVIGTSTGADYRTKVFGTSGSSNNGLGFIIRNVDKDPSAATVLGPSVSTIVQSTSPGTGGTNNSGNVWIDLDSTYLLAMKIEMTSATAATIDLWVIPDGGDATAKVQGTPDLTQTNATFTAGQFMVGMRTTATGAQGRNDNLFLGESWSDVQIAIPEPATLGLLGLGGLALGRRRRNA